MLNSWAAILSCSFVLSALLTGLVRPVALRLGLVAYPRQDRYKKDIVPLGGGIAITATILLAMVLGTIGARILAVRFGLEPRDISERLDELIWLALCICGLFTLGLTDDIKNLGPWTKLLLQAFTAVAAVVFAHTRINLFIHNELITTMLSVLWIMLLINVFNFLDNMDGMCAGIAAIVVAILATAAANSGQVLVGGFAMAFIGALLGFLVHNFPPARIFMGDAGSLVVGFTVAVLSIRTTYYHHCATGPWYPVLMPLITLSVPLYDFVTVVFLRVKQGKSPLVGDTQHFSHRLKRRGLTDCQTALTIYLATLCTGLGGICLYQVDMAGAVMIFLQTVMILGIIAILETYAGQRTDA